MELKSNPRVILWLPLLGVLVLFVVLGTLELVNISLGLPSQIMNLVLTISLAVFAGIEAYSTYIELKTNDEKIVYDKARNELKEAYGPLFALLNKPVEKDKAYVELKVDEKFRLDEIMLSYPYMFSDDINEYWKNNIRNLKTEMGVEIHHNGPFLTSINPIQNAYVNDIYQIPLKFVNLLNEQYDKKVKNFNKWQT